ncbi:MAG TPA: 30S ribosomal protein S8 [Candidatus Faecicola pullistercoris]|nr:30S ribosomal protein S8 [Candidatus Faecicola pullistercoris]
MAMTTDPIADMLTRIRNALVAKHEEVEIPESKMKVAIAKILADEGYIQSFEVVPSPLQPAGEEAKKELQGSIKIKLKYAGKNSSVITGLKRISKPGLRVYANTDNIPSVLNGMGIAILSTSKGVLTDKQAKAANVGGEVLAYIW